MTSQSRPDQFDFSGRRVAAHGGDCRDHGPATPVELPGGVMAWSVTRHEVKKRLADDPRVSRDSSQHWLAFDNTHADRPLSAFVMMTDNALNGYGADHGRLRNLLEPAFTPERIEAVRTLVQGRVDSLVESLLTAEDDEVVDLRNHYAQVISAETLCDLFGVPPEMRDWTRRVMHGLISPSADPAQVAANFADLMFCMGALVADKRAEPGADMISDLIAARENGDRLDEDELVSALLLTIGAGGGTTADLIANAALAVLSDPGQLGMIQTGQADWKGVIEETLRAESPAGQLPLRFAVEDIDLGEGVLIKAGEPILLGLDEAARTCAGHGDQAGPADVARDHPSGTGREQPAFHRGVHHSIGAPVARLQAAIALPALFDHFPEMELAVPADQLPLRPTFVHSGALPVHLNGVAEAVPAL
jgi:cytochrome P450